jgi:hypothetical protein
LYWCLDLIRLKYYWYHVLCLWCTQYGCFESFPFRQNFVIYVRQITLFRWNAQRWTKTPILKT